MSEKTYTLDEARRVMALGECRQHGHSFESNIIRRGGGEIVRITYACDRCGWAGKVEMVGPDPAMPTL